MGRKAIQSNILFLYELFVNYMTSLVDAMCSSLISVDYMKFDIFIWAVFGGFTSIKCI